MCIHQTDGNLKKKGVAHLGVVLLFTGQLLILESDDYMNRLWTVYELATFLSLHPRNRIVMLPVNLPQYVFVGSTVTSILHLVSFFLRSTAVNRIFPVAVTLGVFVGPLVLLPGCIVLVFLTRRSAVEQRRRKLHLLHSFSVGSAECSNEDDRAPVLANISALLKELGHADGMTQEETVRLFDCMIRHYVPEAIRTSVGCSGVTYIHVLLFSLCFMGEGFDTAGSYVAAGTSLREAFPRSAIFFAWHFGGFPMVVLTISQLARHCLHLRGLSHCMYLVAVTIIAGAVSAGIQRLLSMLLAEAGDPVFLFLFIVCSLLTAMVAYCILQPSSRLRGEKHATSNQESLETAYRLRLPISFPPERSVTPGSLPTEPGRQSSSNSLDVASEVAPGGVSDSNFTASIRSKMRIYL